MPPLRHIIITGASGYLGTRLISLALDCGFLVTVLSRSRPLKADGVRLRWFHWDLVEAVPIAAFDLEGSGQPVDTVIHAAHKWDSDLPEERDENITGSRALLAASREAGVKRFLFCSSVSSREGALNRYGRVKRAIARDLKGPNEIEARIGLIYGGSRRGQWGTLCSLVRAFSVFPMAGAYRDVQPIHLDEVCDGLFRLIEKSVVRKTTYVLASSRPVTFGHFMKKLACQTLGRSILIIPVPASVVMALLVVIGPILGLRENYRERILGLIGLPTVKNSDDLNELDLSISNLDDGLSTDKFVLLRRQLLEGYVLFLYLTAAKPGIGFLRRYVRGIEKYTDAKPLSFPLLVRLWPATLALWEPVSKDGGGADNFQGRLHLALLIADAVSPSGTSAYDYVGQGKAKAALRIIAAGILEVIFMPFRLILGRGSK